MVIVSFLVCVLASMSIYAFVACIVLSKEVNRQREFIGEVLEADRDLIEACNEVVDLNKEINVFNKKNSLNILKNSKDNRRRSRDGHIRVF